MLPAAARLRDGQDIAVVSRRGARARRGDIAVAALRSDATTSRAAVVVGKRAGGAVERNRLRRRVRHLLPAQLAALPIVADVVVRVGPGAHGLTPAELSAELLAATRLAADRAASR